MVGSLSSKKSCKKAVELARTVLDRRADSADGFLLCRHALLPCVDF
jgi:hypothetical protein